MLIREKRVVLRDGSEITLRSAVAEDAEELCRHRKQTSSETYFMARYPEECEEDAERTRNKLNVVTKDEKEFMVTAFCGGKVVGDAGIGKISNHIKYLHRGYMGISICEAFCGRGLGRIMVEAVLEQAKSNGFEQVELGVFSDNYRAIHLYESCGFSRTGVIPRAFKLKDGTYRDEIQMVVVFGQ